MTTDGNGGETLLIEGYTDFAQIGSGGFSTVFRAAQPAMARNVAIKVLNTGFGNERQRRTFERECQVMGQLSRHPHIVTVFHSAFSGTGQPCIVMELYRTTLRDRLREGGALPVADVLDIGVKTAGALQAVHDAGILHRDIKPHNIFVSDYGEPALADFGISSVADERTITGGGGFSLDYSAPEVLETIVGSVAADIYGLAATLYHVASGSVPYPFDGPSGDRLRVTIRRIVSDPPPELRRPDAPPGLDRLLREAMAKDPDRRPATAADFARRMQLIQAEMGLPETPFVVSPAQATTAAAPTPTEPGPGEAQARTVTVARTQPDGRPEPGPPVDDTPPETIARRRRATLITVAVLGLGAVAAIALAVLTSGGGDDQPIDPADLGTTIPPADDSTFDVLDAPSDLAVTREDDGGVSIAWSSTEDGVEFEITRVDGDASGESIRVPMSPHRWEGIDPAVTPCFEVRTIGDVRASRDAAGPVCAE
ncbi:MAG: serine/threonine-protein kinase [Actinomycetota bacterium]